MDISEENENNRQARIDPIQLDLNSEFQFRCHPGVPCFTQCCRNIRILLTPYDIIRLKNRLGLSSEEFLAIYTEPKLLEKTDLPVITLKLLDDPDMSCPFVRENGCLVYSDRPSTCRYYPVGMGSLSHKEGVEDTGFFIMIREPHCRGFEEDKVWTIREWRKDQGVDTDDDINAEWTDLLVRKRSFPKNIALTEKSKQLFFMVSYNIDKFREFVFQSSFLDRYPTDPVTVELIRNSEIELLRFGMKWLKSVLFREPEQREAA
jgi:Fe-S-cluster containining protein